MDNTQKDASLYEDEILKENLRVQKTEYIKQKLAQKRAAEDARLERLMHEQEIIEDLRESIDDGMWQTEETRKYNQEFQQHVNMQIYETNGISEDKLMGMSEYKNALYRGAAAVLFLLSLVFTILCGALYGFQSDVCLLMLAYTGMEGALLSQDKKRQPALDFICRAMYIISFPIMMVMFVCYALEFGAYGLLLPYVAILGTCITVFGTISFFLRDPYSLDKKKLRDAKNQIRDIEKLAEKEVRRNQKTQEKDGKNVQKLLGSETQLDGDKFGFLTQLNKQDTLIPPETEQSNETEKAD